MIRHTDPAQAELSDGRQAAQTLAGIEPSHVARYVWAVERLAERFPGGTTILDAACGVGYGAKMLAEAGHRVTAADVSHAAIEFAGTFYHDPGVIFTEGNLLDLELPGVGAVVSFETVEHVKADIMLLERFRSCSPMLLASVPNLQAFPCEGEVARHHWRHYTDTGFRELLTDVGYRVVESGSLNKLEGKVSVGMDGAFMVYLAEETH